MKTHKSAKRFAGMFLGTAPADKAQRALEELAIAQAIMEKSPEFKSLLTSPLFKADDRQKGIVAVGAAAGLSEGTMKFLGFLAAQRAAWAIPDVLRKAIAIYSERINRVSATVVTPSALTAPLQARVLEALKKMTGKDVSVEYSVDQSVMGGLLVKVGSAMFDGTVRGQLRMLKEELIKG